MSPDNNRRLDGSPCYRVRRACHLEGAADVNCCNKRALHILRLSPRERTGAASAVLECEGAVVFSVFIFDAHLRRLWTGVVASQL